MNQVGAYVTLVLLVIVGYLLLIRPARKRALAVQKLQSALLPGAEVMLTSGLFATVVELQDETARVEVAPGVVVRVHRRAVGQIIPEPPPAADAGADASLPTGDTPSDENPGVN